MISLFFRSSWLPPVRKGYHFMVTMSEINLGGLTTW